MCFEFPSSDRADRFAMGCDVSVDSRNACSVIVTGGRDLGADKQMTLVSRASDLGGVYIQEEPQVLSFVVSQIVGGLITADELDRLPEIRKFMDKLRKASGSMAKKLLNKYPGADGWHSIIRDIAIELNSLTRKNGSHKAAIKIIASKLGLDEKEINYVFYATGATAPKLLDFDIEKQSVSITDEMIQVEKAQKSSGVPFEEAKATALNTVKRSRIRGQNKSEMVREIEGCNNYEDLEKFLYYFNLAYQGQKAASKLVTASIALELVVAAPKGKRQKPSTSEGKKRYRERMRKPGAKKKAQQRNKKFRKRHPSGKA